MLRLVLLLLACLITMNSCTPDHLMSPDSTWRMFNGLQQGQYVEWDETIVDSLVMPACLQDSSQTFLDELMKPRTEKWHVIVTIPDSNEKRFRIEKTLIEAPVWDTLALRSQRVAKTVSYGAEFTAYNPDGAVVTQYTGSTLEPVDFNDLPFFEYRPDSMVTSAEKSAFIDTLEDNGFTVTDLGAAGIQATSSMIQSGVSYTGSAMFNGDDLTLRSEVIANSSRTLSETSYEYSSISDLRINTRRVTLNRMRMSPDMQALYIQKMPERNYACLHDMSTKTIVTLSNIVIP